MKIVQNILTNNPCYKAKKKITVKGLMLHSVGCPQPSATVFINQWNRADFKRACVHAFIDGNNGKVYQTLPWNHRGWHGGGKCNDTHIGVEMCEPSNIKYVGGTKITCTDKASAKAVVQRTYDNAVALFAHLCIKYGLDPMTDIISHSEGAVKGIASNHGDPEHLWKQLDTGYTMNTFRKAVKMAMGSDMPHMVKITTSVLNVRGGVGVSYPIKTTVRKGEIYTIVEERNGWGKLKSGVGWISLKYTTKI